MANKILPKRGTRASLTSLKGSSALTPYELLFVTDEGRLEVATANNTSVTFARLDDISLAGKTGAYNDLTGKPTITSGTVTSVAMTVPTGLQVANSPITTSGTLSVTYQAGYQGYTSSEATKLSGIASGATANSSDATLLNRANHTGTQTASTISDFAAAWAAQFPTRLGTVCQTITDWNSALDNGWYMGANVANAPVAGNIWFFGQTIQHNPIWHQQDAYQFTALTASNSQHYRRYNQGVADSWSAWFRVYENDAELDARYLKLAGGAVTGATSFGAGISFGNQVGSAANDLSKHIALYATSYGFSVTSSTLNIVTGGAVNFTVATATKATLDSSGNFTAVGNVSAYSDERIKSEIKTLDNSLEKIKKLRGVSFIKNDAADIGVIAQEVQKVFPEVVSEHEDLLAVNYSALIGPLIEAVKELSAKVEALENR